MDATEFDEIEFFRGIGECGTKALLIGRRALVVLGLPVLTADYDFWIDADGAAAFNEVASRFGLAASRTPEEARRAGRYVLQNDEKVDVLVARSVTTVDGQDVSFESVWGRRRVLELAPGIAVALPCLADLIATKRFVARPKDLEDIRLLEMLRSEEKD